MDQTFKKQMEDNGADVDTTLKRFMGNEALYMKFIMKFLDDKSYDGITECMNSGDYEEVFKHAHTLKGVTANLGLDPITAVASDISELLRGKSSAEADVEKLQELYKQLEEVHSRFCEILKANK